MKKISLILVFVALGLIFLNCENAGLWKSGRTIGFEDQNEDLNEFIFLSESVGIAFGSKWTDEAILSNNLNTGRKAVIYRTTDGGKHWKPVVLGNGTFISASSASDTLFALKKTYYGEAVDQVNVFLYSSTDKGETWEEVREISNGAYQINFCDGRTGTAFTAGFDTTYGRAIIKTLDGGKTWQKLEVQPENIRSITCLTAETISILSSTEVDKLMADHLVIKNLTSGEEVVHKLSGIRAGIQTTDTAGQIWIMGYDANKVLVLYKRETTGNFFQIKTFSSKGSLFPEALHVSGESISVLTSVLDKSVLEEKGKIFPVAVHYEFFHSEDAGKTWTEENIPVDYLVKPYAFHGKDKVWMNAGGGYIQWRE